MNDDDVYAFLTDAYKDGEITMSPVWSEDTEPDKVYPSQCFYRAYLYVSALSLRLRGKERVGIYLVHGESAFALGPHAWVELPGDVVFDGVRQRFYRLSSYGAAPWYKYTPSAAIVINANMPADENGQQSYAFYRPLKLPWGDTANPLVIDFDRAIELLVTSGLRPGLAKPPVPRKRRSR